MGKSGGRRKKAGQSVSGDLNSGNGGTVVDLDPTIFVKKAHELKEEGNKCFQSKDYVGALEQYDQALKLTPKSHPDRAVLHSNRAACLMQMKPVQYETVIAECSLALQFQPRYSRALLRRARALEALGKFEIAMRDVQSLLQTDPKHEDALEIGRRLQIALGSRQEAQHDLHNRSLSSSSYAGTSPAALGASAVRGSPIGGLGPCLPARPMPKKNNHKPEKSILDDQSCVQSNGSDFPDFPELLLSKSPAKVSSSAAPLEPIVLKPSKAPPKSTLQQSKDKDIVRSDSHERSDNLIGPWRPLKLVFDHDIRLAQMPAKCSFRVLREVVSKRFPSSGSVLVKYKDLEGDLVTITSTRELRLAESCVDQLALKKKMDDEKQGGPGAGNVSNVESGSDSHNHLEVLRLHVVEVNPEQEPVVEEDEKSIQDSLPEDEGIKGDENASRSSTVSEGVDSEIDKRGSEEEARKEGNNDKNNQVEYKEVEIDDWLFEFAQLFRQHVGIDPDAHVDLHELGMELCSEALEETVTSEEAQSLFDMAACKFQEVAALAFFNWGNVHMCAARKRIPVDDSVSKEVITKQLQTAYDWVQERYSLAGEKYEEALRIKPDFYEGLLALGQQHFETAKLRWSFALANKVDLETWDSSETVGLFDSAEEKMKAATEMWEKLEEQRNNELKDPSASKKEELLKRRKKHASGTDVQAQGSSQVEVSPDEAAEQAAIMRSQIHLFWGNMLFERSQVEFKLGLGNWEKNLDAAVERFKLAGASEMDISVVLKNHSSNVIATEGEEKKISGSRIDVAEGNHIVQA